VIHVPLYSAYRLGKAAAVGIAHSTATAGAVHVHMAGATNLHGAVRGMASMVAQDTARHVATSGAIELPVATAVHTAPVVTHRAGDRSATAAGKASSTGLPSFITPRKVVVAAGSYGISMPIDRVLAPKVRKIEALVNKRGKVTTRDMASALGIESSTGAFKRTVSAALDAGVVARSSRGVYVHA
jgi:hypothetical protein